MLLNVALAQNGIGPEAHLPIGTQVRRRIRRWSGGPGSGCPAFAQEGQDGTISLPTPTIRTARLLLSPFTSSDADDLFKLHSSALVLRYWDAPPWSERARPSDSSRPVCGCRRKEAGRDWQWTVCPTGRSSDGAC